MTNYWKDRLYVTIQFILMLLLIVPFNFGHFAKREVLGVALFIVGSSIAAMAIWQLRHSISPFPSPKKSAQLINNGVFRWMRHPIYTGILFVALAYTLLTGSVWRVLVTIALFILFHFKARHEERLLMRKFETYTNYMTKSGRFLPKLP